MRNHSIIMGQVENKYWLIGFVKNFKNTLDSIEKDKEKTYGKR